MEETIMAAYHKGINHFEPAQGYGQSEEFLGRALQRLGIRSEVYVTTKITPQPTKEAMERAIAKSFQALNKHTIDGLAIHGINTQEHLEWILQPHGCMAAIHEAQKSGIIRNIGFSTHGPLEIILKTIQTNLFDFINLHYNYFFQRNQPALEAALQRDMGTFIISPADKGGQLFTPSSKLQQLCKPYSPLHWAYRFLLSQPSITTLSLGAANPTELDWPLEIADSISPLSEIEQNIYNQLEYQAKSALGQDQCHQCYACLPCPEEINIPEVLRLRNLAKAYGMKSFGEYRYQMFERAGHWFPGKMGSRCTECGDCLPRCPHELAIAALVIDTHQLLHQPSRPRLWDDRP